MRVFVRIAIRRGKIDFLEVLEHQYLIELGRGWGAETYKEEVDLLHRKASYLNFEPEIILDIGANIGKYTRELAQHFPDSTIYSFEPNPNAFVALGENLKFVRNCKLVNVALSSRNFTGVLYEPEKSSPLSSLDNKGREYSAIEVQVTTLDTFCEKERITPDIIKIDVEGHEYNVLQGGINILNNVRMIQFEFGPTNIHSRIFFRDFWGFLTNNGFKLSVMSKSGLIDISEYKEIYESFRTTNYLACREIQ